MIVLDASAAIEWLLRTPKGLDVERRLFIANETLHAPHLLDVEVAQVLRRFVTRGALSARRAEQAIQDLKDTAITRYPHTLFLPRIWSLRANLSAYDAAYVSLAEALPGTLLTMDVKLVGAAGHRAHVEVV